MSGWFRRFWNPEEVRWGIQPCLAPECEEPAELIYDGEPLCIDHADALLERHCLTSREIKSLPGLRDWWDL